MQNTPSKFHNLLFQSFKFHLFSIKSSFSNLLVAAIIYSKTMSFLSFI